MCVQHCSRAQKLIHKGLSVCSLGNGVGGCSVPGGREPCDLPAPGCAKALGASQAVQLHQAPLEQLNCRHS